MCKRAILWTANRFVMIYVCAASPNYCEIGGECAPDLGIKRIVDGECVWGDIRWQFVFGIKSGFSFEI